MFDMTFPTPEILHKHRDSDENINQKILQDEEIDKHNKNLSELFDKNLNKYFSEKDHINESTDLIDFDDKEEKDRLEDKNELTDIFEEDGKFRPYKFESDEDILYSFEKASKDHKIMYTPYKRSKFINVNYLLDKKDVSENLSREIYDHFNSNLTNQIY